MDVYRPIGSIDIDMWARLSVGGCGRTYRQISSIGIDWRDVYDSRQEGVAPGAARVPTFLDILAHWIEERAPALTTWCPWKSNKHHTIRRSIS
ncbi:unnamed protein product [Angiostrongylus costaricensis]|uniref:Transposase n=1 Tax=Angiostrongylus costaricensis TaxID=334426 RepID=A0A0R3PAV3_ANGCS|nr:unnamed protein product [Angiostrongylus costaricensis]